MYYLSRFYKYCDSQLTKMQFIVTKYKHFPQIGGSGRKIATGKIMLIWSILKWWMNDLLMWYVHLNCQITQENTIYEDIQETIWKTS